MPPQIEHFEFPDLPEGWALTTMGKVAQVVGGGTPDSKDPSNFCESGGHAWLTPADLSGHSSTYVSRGKRNLTDKGLRESSAKLMPADTVLMSSRAPIGYVAVAANEVSTNQGFKSFVCGDGVQPEFVLFWLRFIRAFLEQMGSGSTFAEISGSRAKHVPLHLAPHPEQRRIVGKIETLLARVNAARERLAKLPAILKRFRQSVLAAACSGRLTADWRESHPEIEPASELLNRVRRSHRTAALGHGGKAADSTEEVHDLSREDFPDTWELADLMELCEPGRPIVYGILKPGPDISGGVPYVRVADFPNDRINLGTVRRTSPTIAKQYSRATLYAGDVLLSIRGTVGRVCRVPKELAGGNITQDSARITIHHEVDPDYVETYLRSPAVGERFKRALRGVAVRGINIGDVRALQVALPPLNEQREIMRRAEGLFKLAEAIENRVQAATTRSEKLSQSILAKAFRGELVPQDPNDEPSSMLLERIRVARAATEIEDGLKRKGNRRPKASQKAEGFMLNRKDIKPMHLNMILRERGPLTAEALWSASQLDIDDFYDQLKDEEARGILKEARSESPSEPRMLETA